MRRLLTVAVLIAAIATLAYVWTNVLGPNRSKLPGMRIIEIDPGTNIP
jgi:hypothetical protein